MKKFLKLMSFVFIFSFLWVIGSTNVKADGLSLSMQKKLSLTIGDERSIGVVLYFDGKKIDDNYASNDDMELTIESIEWKRSNKNVSLLSYYDDDIEGANENNLYADKIGKTKLTLTIKYREEHFEKYDNNYNVIKDSWTSYGSVTKSIWVTVKPHKTLRLGGGLYEYDTRENIFKTQIYNPTNRKIRIYSKGAYSLDCDYKKFDRKVKLTRRRKYVDLKPGKWTNVNFKVIGRTTWWKVDDEEIHCKCKFKGKKYTLSIETERIMKWTKNGWRKISID